MKISEIIREDATVKSDSPDKTVLKNSDGTETVINKKDPKAPKLQNDNGNVSLTASNSSKPTPTPTPKPGATPKPTPAPTLKPGTKVQGVT